MQPDLKICPLCSWQNGRLNKLCVKCERIAELEKQVKELQVSQQQVHIRPLCDVERELIIFAAMLHGKMKAAELLGIGKTTVYRKLHQYQQNHA